MSVSNVEIDDDDHSRIILHFDIDCFYAQAETLLDPTLSGKPGVNVELFSVLLSLLNEH